MHMQNTVLLINEHDLENTLDRITEKVIERVKNELDTQHNEVYLSPKKVAEMLDIHVTTLYRWEKQNYLIPIRIGTKVRYRKSDIDKLLDQEQIN
jgi:excisionase family DNA binding protein